MESNKWQVTWYQKANSGTVFTLLNNAPLYKNISLKDFLLQQALVSMLITWGHCLKIAMASSLLGGAPAVGVVGIRVRKCLQTRKRTPSFMNKHPLSPIRSILQQLKALPSWGSWRRLWGRHAITDFTRGRGIPALRARVTHPSSPASQWAGLRPSLLL